MPGRKRKTRISKQKPLARSFPLLDIEADVMGCDDWDERSILDDLYESSKTEKFPLSVHKTWVPVPARRSPPLCRWPVWERKVRLIAEARVRSDARLRQHLRLLPIDVHFTSPPALDREVIACGYVSAQFATGSLRHRRLALPFQGVFSAWPVRNGDSVHGDLITFVGGRVCPILVTDASGHTHRMHDLKVVFEALIRVCPQGHHGRY